MKGKRQQRTIGSIIKIDLGNGFHSYGRILPDSAFAFYDCKTKENISDLQRIVSSPILFINSIHKLPPHLKSVSEWSAHLFGSTMLLLAA